MSSSTNKGSAGTGSSSGQASLRDSAPPGTPADLLAALSRVGGSSAAIRRWTAESTQLDDTIRELQNSGDSDASSKIAKLRADFKRSVDAETKKLKSQAGSGAQGSNKSSGA